MPPEKLQHGKITEETADDRTVIDSLLAIAHARCIAMGLAPGMVVTRGTLSRWWLERRKDPAVALFDAADWRNDALGGWLGEFLAGKADVSITWRNGRPFLAGQ